MGMMTKARCLEKQKLEVEKIDLGDGDFIYVREMYGSERNAFELSLRKYVKEDEEGDVAGELDLSNFNAKFVVSCACDEKGRLLFKPEDALTLGNSMGFRRLSLISGAAAKLNKWGEEQKAAVIKNSGAAQSGDSGSVSAKK